MALRKSPARTPAFLAANRANAWKSTGPRTPQGKARVALNALKHGRYAAALPQALRVAGRRADEAQYQWFRSQIAAAFCPPSGPVTERDEQQVERLAATAWSQARRVAVSGTNPESCLFSKGKSAWHPMLSRIGIVDRARRIGLVFWLQRCKRWTRRELLEALLDGVPVAHRHRGGPVWEGRWRRSVYRLQPPGLWERIELEQARGRRLR